MNRPTVARVDLSAIRDNFTAITRFLSDSETPTPRVIAVVKANAYGHGAPEVARALEQAGAAMLACADIEEGVVLREAGVRVPILVFGALSVSDLEGVFSHRLTPTISTPSAARALQQAAARHATTLRCHLKIDTGMNRLGLPARQPRSHAAARSRPARTWRSTRSTPTSPPPTRRTIRRSASSGCASTRPARGCRGSASRCHARHAANSAALLRDERVWYDFVRPGLLLYGVVPPPLASTIALRPALSLHSRIVAVKGLRPGEGVGYGLRDAADSVRTVAVVPAGYADGLDLRLAGRGHMLVRGRRAPVVGSVCMDMSMIDVTGIDVAPGDEVVIVGAQAPADGRRARNRRVDRHDPVRAPVPRRRPHPAQVRLTPALNLEPER